MDLIKSANLARRFLLELCALVAVGYWGVQTGRRLTLKLVRGIGGPLWLVALWATVVAPKAPVSLPGPGPFILGLVILGLAASLLGAAG
jgi:hypothetical protein